MPSNLFPFRKSQKDLWNVIKKEIALFSIIWWLVFSLDSLGLQSQTLIHDFKNFAGLTAQEKQESQFGPDIANFAEFCERNIPQHASINWETQSSFYQFRLAYYLLYPRILSPNPQYLIVYRPELNSVVREYAFHPIDVLSKEPTSLIYPDSNEIIGQSWISGHKTNSISQINLFLDNDYWTTQDRIELTVFQSGIPLRTIEKKQLNTLSTGRTPFVFNQELKIKPNTEYYFTLRIFSTHKTGILINIQNKHPKGNAIRFGKPQPYDLCFQIFRGYTDYSIFTTYHQNAYIMIPKDNSISK